MLKTLSAVNAGVALSVARTVKLNVPIMDGAPLMTPLLEDKLSPAGKAPVRIDHV